jgi:hypothetical protein
MTAVIVFNLAGILLCVGVLAHLVPFRLYGGLLRGLHNTIGITTPTDRQLQWVLVVWIVSMVAIVDLMAVLFAYVF